MPKGISQANQNPCQWAHALGKNPCQEACYRKSSRGCCVLMSYLVKAKCKYLNNIEGILKISIPISRNSMLWTIA